MIDEDRKWMYAPRRLPEFENGLVEFLDLAFAKVARSGQILCPCKNCKNRYWYHRDEVWNHVMGNGFVENYSKWSFHGEGTKTSSRGEKEDDMSMHDNIDDMLGDLFRGIQDIPDKEGPNEDAKKFYRLLEEGKKDLYPGCKNFSKLSFTIRLFLFKTTNGLSNVAFSDLLVLLKEMVPDVELPSTFNEARKMLKDIGLDYQKIHACPKDCMLYWMENEHATSCKFCNTSRWKSDEGGKHKKNIPAKVLRYFPIKQRLKMLYMCSETTKSMLWHDVKRPKDGNIRHPADGEAWKKFDTLHPHFSQEPRNVRLGLASDGFNPFRTMSIAHSTWPVVLINYNLHPLLSMKAEYLMLTLLIPGPDSPGNDIDVYMQPSIHELRELWDNGVETYDKFNNNTFQLRAAVLWTISDFPGYSMLSCYKTKGKLACPDCNYDTSSLYLKHSRKTVYMDHRRFLDANHPKRTNKRSFNGQVEQRAAPKPLSGVDIAEELSNFNNVFGKSHKKKVNSNCPWKKRSIFFDLPYWKFNLCRHNLDVMHIEKNICDNLVGTLLDIPGKTKDHTKARLDLLEMGIKQDLHLVLSEDGRHVYLKKACFSLSQQEKERFCLALKEAKLPYACGSNIARCVHISERKLSGYKSHDAHILLHYLLQVAVRRSLPKHVAIVLIRLGAFFKKLCSKVLTPQDLDHLEDEIKNILCDLEGIFLPAFFDIMVHLPIHLVREIRLGGPVQYRWMYFMERFLCKLKSYVRNRHRPEGSIAEGYLLEECLTFCSRYLHDVANRKLNKIPKKSDVQINRNDECGIFKKLGHPLGGKKRKKGKLISLDANTIAQAHRYALFNSESEELDELIREHQQYIDNSKRKSKWSKTQGHSIEFANWLKDKAMSGCVQDHIYWLAKGPSSSARRYGGYYMNGYRFYTKDRDTRCKTQNSGVSVTAFTTSFASSKDDNPVDAEVTYYGAILDMIELNYWPKFQVVLFKCEWYQVEKDEYGLLCVNSTKLCSRDDPFVMPSQVHQVFYVPDPVVNGLSYVMEKVPQDFFEFDVGEELSDVAEDNYWVEPRVHSESSLFENVIGYDENMSREDVPPTILNANVEMVSVGQVHNEHEADSKDDTSWDWMHASDDDH